MPSSVLIPPIAALSSGEGILEMSEQAPVVVMETAFYFGLPSTIWGLPTPGLRRRWMHARASRT
eukprot:14087261-Alexandrium_andersonii.AAC.1